LTGFLKLAGPGPLHGESCLICLPGCSSIFWGICIFV
jgi:hypothetical protein